MGILGGALTRTLGASATIAALACATLLGAGTTDALAAGNSTTLSCILAPGVLNVSETVTLDSGAVLAPASVAPGGTFSVSLTPTVTLPAAQSISFVSIGVVSAVGSISGLVVNGVNVSPASIALPQIPFATSPIVSGQPTPLVASSPVSTGPFTAATGGASTATLTLGGSSSITMALSGLDASGNVIEGPLSVQCNPPATGADVATVPITANTLAAPVITSQPVGVTVPSGSQASLSAAASGTPAPTVQWQSSTDGGTTWTDIAGATSDTLTVTVNTSGTEYRAVFTNAAGTAISNAVSFTVIACGDLLPTITAQPSSVTVTAGQTATFTAAARSACPGATVPVQWETSTDGGTTWSDVSGATSTTLTVTNTTVAESGTEYRAEFIGGLGAVDTTAATLTVTPPAPPPPTVTRVLPSSGPPFSVVIVQGTSFRHVLEVDFGAGHRAFFLALTPRLLIALAPSEASGTKVDVTVRTSAGTSAASSADTFTFN